MRKTTIVVMAIILMFATSCETLKRTGKDIKSDFTGGLNRIVTVYTADGEVLKTYEGKIDLESTEGGIVKFDLNGHRIMYFNCYVEVLEKLD